MKAAQLALYLENPALTETGSPDAVHRGVVRYLFARVSSAAGQADEVLKLLESTLAALPDLPALWLEMRGDLLELQENWFRPDRSPNQPDLVEKEPFPL